MQVYVKRQRRSICTSCTTCVSFLLACTTQTACVRSLECASFPPIFLMITRGAWVSSGYQAQFMEWVSGSGLEWSQAWRVSFSMGDAYPNHACSRHFFPGHMPISCQTHHIILFYHFYLSFPWCNVSLLIFLRVWYFIKIMSGMTWNSSKCTRGYTKSHRFFLRGVICYLSCCVVSLTC